MAAHVSAPTTDRTGVRYSTFRPGAVWKDTGGDTIRAHSGGLLDDPNSGLTYWYGSEGYPGGAAVLNTKINVYSSSDLMNWKSEGVAFDMPNRPECNKKPATCYADRCKVLWNAATSKYVMWCKSKPWVSVSESRTSTGPFKLVNLILPGGHEVGDCSVFNDPTHTDAAYLVLSVHPSSYGLSHNDSRQVKIYPLNADFTNVTGVSTDVTAKWPLPNKYDGKLEAPAPFYDATNEMFYIWASHCTYWFPNDAYLLSSPSLTSAAHWKPNGNPTHNDTSYSTQSTYVLAVKAAARQRAAKPGVPKVSASWIYISDRFEPYISQNTTGRYVWLPIERAKKGGFEVKWYDEWTL